MKNTDISKLLAKEWKTASQEVRQLHIDKEAREREEYHRKIAAWRKKQRQTKVTVASTKNVPSLFEHPELLSVQSQTTPLSQSPSLTLSTKFDSSHGPTVIPSGTGQKTVEWSASFSTPEYLSKDVLISSDQTVPKEAARTSFVFSKPMDTDTIKTVKYSPLRTVSNASVLQKFDFPKNLPTPPFLLMEQKPSSLRPIALQSTRYPSVEPTPLQDPPTAVRKVSTSDYQNLFFPSVLNDGEDGTILDNSPLEQEHFDFFLDGIIEDTD